MSHEGSPALRVDDGPEGPGGDRQSYFTLPGDQIHQDAAAGAHFNRGRAGNSTASSVSSDTSTVVSPPAQGLEDLKESILSLRDDGKEDARASRKSSNASVAFQPLSNPTLPQGHQKLSRFRSPSPER